MCFRSVSATVSRRRRQSGRQAPTLPPLAVLDLGKPGERQAHDFLCRATRGRGGIWELITLRRRGGSLLCVVRWVRIANRKNAFSVATLDLAGRAVSWHDHGTLKEARAELEQRCGLSAVPPSEAA